ncbi:hypothetical protein TSUD_189930 [Trifolium subterraneum]|uniref:Uncharacterized protein n=1 Tax=Trifolium subterraneum TaxID=3900 RepID=A0A2Z6NA45_TRISU|nr:hypothetical protein TSUD_189930 [Trifolium subterraneum]
MKFITSKSHLKVIKWKFEGWENAGRCDMNVRRLRPDVRHTSLYLVGIEASKSYVRRPMYYVKRPNAT